MATAQRIDRPRDWHIGEIDHQGEVVEVWQHCREDRIMDLYPNAAGLAMLATVDGEQAIMPEFGGVLVPEGVPRVIVIDEVDDDLIGATLRIPSLDVSVSEVASILPPLT